VSERDVALARNGLEAWRRGDLDTLEKCSRLRRHSASSSRAIGTATTARRSWARYGSATSRASDEGRLTSSTPERAPWSPLPDRGKSGARNGPRRRRWSSPSARTRLSRCRTTGHATTPSRLSARHELQSATGTREAPLALARILAPFEAHVRRLLARRAAGLIRARAATPAAVCAWRSSGPRLATRHVVAMVKSVTREDVQRLVAQGAPWGT
jgi:hypothetical protein